MLKKRHLESDFTNRREVQALYLCEIARRLLVEHGPDNINYEMIEFCRTKPGSLFNWKSACPAESEPTKEELEKDKELAWKCQQQIGFGILNLVQNIHSYYMYHSKVRNAVEGIARGTMKEAKVDDERFTKYDNCYTSFSTISREAGYYSSEDEINSEGSEADYSDYEPPADSEGNNSDSADGPEEAKKEDEDPELAQAIQNSLKDQQPNASPDMGTTGGATTDTFAH